MADPATEDRIVISALDLAATRGWSDLTMADIAAGAGVSLVDVSRLYPDKPAILDGLGRLVDAAMLGGGPTEEGESTRDRLFDAVMRRFDCLNPHKAGLAAVLNDLRGDPVTALGRLPTVERSARWTLELAGVPTGGVRGALRVRLLGLALGLVTRTWLTDDSEDMARTMKELDQRLSQLEQLANSLDRSFSRRGKSRDDEQPEASQPSDL